MDSSGTQSAASLASPTRRGWVMAAVLLATIMQVIDITIAAVAIPRMQGNLSATSDQISVGIKSSVCLK